MNEGFANQNRMPVPAFDPPTGYEPLQKVREAYAADARNVRASTPLTTEHEGPANLREALAYLEHTNEQLHMALERHEKRIGGMLMPEGPLVDGSTSGTRAERTPSEIVARVRTTATMIAHSIERLNRLTARVDV